MNLSVLTTDQLRRYIAGLEEKLAVERRTALIGRPLPLADARAELARREEGRSR
jgi:hypothetical protein